MTSRNLFFAFLALATVCLSACNDEPGTLFTLVGSDYSGVDFNNHVLEDDSFNIMTYEYLYNGGGVAVGDVNNDGLPDLYFSGNSVSNKLYLNQGKLKFQDVTDQTHTGGRSRWKTGVAMVDINGDGLLDIYVCYSGPGADVDRKNELYINEGIHNGVPAFRECAQQYGLDAEGTFTTHVAFFDMDRDNDLDLFMVNHADMFYNAFLNTKKLRRTRHAKFGNRLYRNDNGSFTDVSEIAGIDGSGLNFGLSVSVSDLNQDGWPDLYVTNDYNEQDFLYLNNRNGTFREVLQRSMGHISQFSMGSNIEDYDNDLKPDIFTLDMLPETNARQKLLKGPDGYDQYQLKVDNGFHHQNMRNMLHRFVGLDGDSIPRFSEIGQLANISATDWSWAPLLGDFNNDGWKDLYVTNGYLRDFTNMDFLKFTVDKARQELRAGEKLNTWKLVQQMPATQPSNYAFCNTGNGHFRDTTEAWGLRRPSVSTGAALADLDNDGDQDIVVNNINEKAFIYENHASENASNHFVKIKLKGRDKNCAAIGAKVMIAIGYRRQFFEVYNTRGFQSTTDPLVHAGIGSDTMIDTIRIGWPDGKESLLLHVNADTTIVVDHASANIPMPKTVRRNKIFEDITLASGISYQHEANSFTDFKYQYLLPHQLSKQGPALAKADVNGDGTEDLFIGSTTGNSWLYIQNTQGSFYRALIQPWNSVDEGSISAATFLDADGDGDADLYTALGGTEFPINDVAYQDKLYINNGKGSFSISPNALPLLTASAGCVAAADYDRDGDVDIFIGSRVLPGKYPVAPVSYLIRNESSANGVRFEYASEQVDKHLRTPGLVTTALWIDMNKDEWPELVIAGEFMPITIFENRKGMLVDATKAFGLSDTNGWWVNLHAADVDGDGDQDLVAGNAGDNFPFKPTFTHPVSVVFDDFDKNGSIDPILCSYADGLDVPYASLDEIAAQLPSVRKKYLKYEQYAQATIGDLLTIYKTATQQVVKAQLFSSCLIENRIAQTGKMKTQLLPGQAQYAPAFGILAEDVDQDRNMDLLIAGNYYPWRVQMGRTDANLGLLLRGKSKNQFQEVSFAESGFFVPGDVRALLRVRTVGGTLYVVGKHDDDIQILKRWDR